MPRKDPRYQPLTPEQIEANLGALDYAIFARLPDEGRTLGYHPLFKSVRQLTEELNSSIPNGAPKLTTGSISARLRGLAKANFVAPVSISFSGRPDGWQRTERAKRRVPAEKGGAK